MIKKQFLLESLKLLTKEAFEGQGEGGSYYVTSNPKTGLFGTLESINSTIASKSTSVSGNTIAAHVYHICYYLKVSNSDFTFSPIEYHDDESWAIKTVDDVEWKQIQKDLHHEYEIFLNTIDEVDKWEEADITVALQTLAHTAYHLGSIRQMNN